MLAYLIFAATAIVCLVSAVFYFYPASRRPTTVPGPDPSDPKEGNLGDISSAGGLHDYLVELHEEFGDIVSFWWGKELVISLGSPDLLKETAHMFNRPPQLFAFLEDLVGKKSIQYANGKDGRMRREQYDKCFSHAACISYFPIIKKVSDDLVEQLQNVPVGDHVPVHKYMTAFAIKNVLKCCFGGISDEDIVHIALEYDVAMNEMQRKLSGQLLPDEDPREHRYRKSLKVLHGSVKRIVDHWRKERGGARNGEDSSHLFLDTIIDFVEGKAELSEQEKLDIIYSDTMSYLVGGFHTTGNLLTWVIYHMAASEEVQERVYEELRSRGNDAEDLQHCLYTRRVLDESLRLSILAPFAARYQELECFLGNHHIPRGTPIIHALGVVLHHPTFWAHPHKFDPDRFLPENAKERPSLAFCPFGFAGKRKCPGYRFAYMESLVLLCTLCKAFKFELVDRDLEPVPMYGFVTKPKEEIWLHFIPRK